MTLTAERPRAAPRAVCATPGCGTVLSRFNDDHDGLCAACRRRQSEAEPERAAERVDIDRLVAGILLTHDALHPGEPCNVALELAAIGIEADCWQIRLAVRHLASRHGIIARGRRLRPGYTVERWERRYEPVVGFGGVLVPRDERSGRWRAVQREDEQLELDIGRSA